MTTPPALGPKCEATLPARAVELLALRGRECREADAYLRRHRAVRSGATERVAALDRGSRGGRHGDR